MMSICKVMGLETDKFDVIDIISDNDSSDGGVQIHCDFGGVMTSISLSRFADMRERKLVINRGAVSLDFSSKPIIQENGEFLREVEASSRLFPVAQTLTDFVSYPENRDALALSVKSLMPEIKFCFECEEQFVNYISNHLESYDQDECNVKTFNPSLVYYAAILYYRQIVSSTSDPGIHYVKGGKGVEELLGWWHSAGSLQ